MRERWQSIRKRAVPAVSILAVLAQVALDIGGYQNRFLANVLWVVIALGVLWMLWPIMHTRLRRRRDAVAEAKTVEAAVNIAVGVTVEATGTVTSPWSAGAAEPTVLHAMFPQTKGVLLWCRHAESVPEAYYLCDVTFEGTTATARDIGVKSDGRLDCIYPKDFDNAPHMPLRDGEYKVEWFRDLGIGRELVLVTTFERRAGKLRREWES